MENDARRKCVEKKFIATDCGSKDLAVLVLSSRSLSSLRIKSSLVAAHREQIWHVPTCSSVFNIFARPKHICFNFVLSHETVVFWHLQIQVLWHGHYQYQVNQKHLACHGKGPSQFALHLSLMCLPVKAAVLTQSRTGNCTPRVYWYSLSAWQNLMRRNSSIISIAVHSITQDYKVRHLYLYGLVWFAFLDILA